MGDPFARDARGRPGYRDCSHRLAVLIEYEPGDTAKPKRMFFVVDGETALARQGELMTKRRPIDDGLFRQPPHGLALKRLGEVAVGCRAEERLADARAIKRHARAAPGEGARHLAALALRPIYRLVFLLA